MVTFDIIHDECRGDFLTKSYKEHQTVVSEDLEKYPENDKDKMVYLETKAMICGCKGN